MFDSSSSTLQSSPVGPAASELRDVLTGLAAYDGHDVDDAERIDQLRALEELKAAAAAAQARITVAFEASQRAAARPDAKAAQVSRSVGSQVALARRDSPFKGARHLGLAKALVHDMPRTLTALARGEISEWRATLMVRETAHLTLKDRRQVDAELGDRIGTMGDRQVEREARALGYRLDPGSAIRRTRQAESDRRVSVRPAPDRMSFVTGLLPVAQGVSIYATLRKHAESLRAQGDPRSLGQLMADTFLARLTGREAAQGTAAEISLVMTDKSLLGADSEPAHLAGYGPVPAILARRLVRDSRAATWVRRLYADPSSGELVAMDSRRRSFDGVLRRFLVLRDQTCRTPWCDAPIRHADHVVPVREGGTTSASNGEGLCEACNYAKETDGWRTDVVEEIRHTTVFSSPTGHRYRSRAPDPPGGRRLRTGSAMEARLRRIIDAA